MPNLLRPRPPLPYGASARIKALKHEGRTLAAHKGHHLTRFSEAGGYRESWTARCTEPRCWAMLVVLGPLDTEGPLLGGTALIWNCGPHHSPLRFERRNHG